MEPVTDHARTRMQQRGIRPEVLEALLDFGRSRHLHSGGREVVYFDKKAKARLARENPAAAREAARLTRTAIAALWADLHTGRRGPRSAARTAGRVGSSLL